MDVYSDLHEDPEMDLEKLMESVSASKTVTQQKAAMETPKVEEPLDPLSAAIANKNKNKMEDMVEEEFVEEVQSYRPTYDDDKRRADFAKYVDDQNTSIDKLKYLVAIKKPKTELEVAEMMTELENISVDGSTGVVTMPEWAKWFVAKTPEVEKQIAYINEKGGAESEESSEEPVDTSRKNTVRILIDKTGLGGEINFTDEERKILSTVEAIELVEVVGSEDVPITEFEKFDESVSFMQAIEPYTPSLSSTPSIFPVSGFKADMTGLNYAEKMDLTVDVSDESRDHLNFDIMYRRYNIVYDHMTNISCGNFANFEDFLKNFAHLDLDIAVFGMLVSTEPEISEVSFTCRNKDCKERGKRFAHTYSPRALIDFNTATPEYLELLDKVVECKPEDRLKVAKSSLVRTRKRFRIPKTNFFIDLGAASAYEYLYGIIGYYNQLEKQGGEENRALAAKYEIASLLLTLRAVSVIGKDGKLIGTSKPEEIVEFIIKYFDEHSIRVLKTMITKYRAKLGIRFLFKDIKCPHCGHVTKRLGVSPDELLFLTRLRQVTPVMLKDIDVM